MSYHAKIMNMPHMSGKDWAYVFGHRDARHSAAEIANDADTEIESLRAIAKDLAEAMTPDEWTEVGTGHKTYGYNADKMQAALARYKELTK